MLDKEKLKMNWSRRAVVYQIYPRSFKDSTGNGIGDLKGITQKLDYLNDGTDKSLGVEAIWLSPVYKSPMRDFGYDISDYRDIDPIFGALADFDKFLSEAHRRDIKVIMDFVANHTSSDHPWFIESQSSRSNPKRDWYIWKDPKKDGSPPNNWLSVFGGSAWEYDEETKQYYMHSFLADQPDLNWQNPEVRKEMEDILHFWMHRGVDGFRTDAIYHLIKDPEFRDDPINPAYVPDKDDPYNALIHKYSQGRPELISTTNSLCEAVGIHSNKFMVSEAYLGVGEMAEMYSACENKLHAPFNFNLMYHDWSAEGFKNTIDEFEKNLQEDDWPNYVLGNHDRPRLATRVGRAQARLLAMMQLTLRGMPFIYYGDELGMKDIEMDPEECKDPWGQNNPSFNRDPERSPMQWDASKHAGFTTGDPWLPVRDDYKEFNAEVERQDPSSFFNLYRSLIQYRKESHALLTGKYKSFDAKNGYVFGYTRICPAETLVILLNFDDKEQIAQTEFSEGRLVCNTKMDISPGTDVNLSKLTLRPYEGYVVSIK